MPLMIDEASERALKAIMDKGSIEMVMRTVEKSYAPFENLKVKWVDEVKDKVIDQNMIRNLMRNVNSNSVKLDQIIPKLDQIFQPLQNLQILSILNTALSAANLIATVAGMVIICDKLNGIDHKLDKIQKEIADIKEINYEMEIAKPCRKVVDDYILLSADLSRGKPVPEEKLLGLIREAKDYIISIYRLRGSLPLDDVLNLIFTLLPILANSLMVYYQRFYDPNLKKHPLHDSCMAVFDMLSSLDFIDQVQDYMFIDKHQYNRQVNEYLDCHRLIVYSYKRQIEQLLEDLEDCGSKEKYDEAMQWCRQYVAQQAKSVQAELEAKYGQKQAKQIMAEAGL